MGSSPSRDRSILEIMISVQENEPDLTETELRLCVESLRNILHFYHTELQGLIDAADDGDKAFRFKARLATDFIGRMFKVKKRSPREWLGRENVPGSKEQVARLEWAKKLFERATGEKL